MNSGFLALKALLLTAILLVYPTLAMGPATGKPCLEGSQIITDSWRGLPPSAQIGLSLAGAAILTGGSYGMYAVLKKHWPLSITSYCNPTQHIELTKNIIKASKKTAKEIEELAKKEHIEKVIRVIGKDVFEDPSSECSPTALHLVKNIDSILNETPLLQRFNQKAHLLNILDNVIQKERILNKKGYFTFVHAQQKDFYFPTRLYTFLWNIKNLTNNDNFLFLHLRSLNQNCVSSYYEKLQKTFLNSFGSIKTLWKNKLLFMNYALFANFRHSGSSSISYLTGNYNIAGKVGGFTLSAADACKLIGYPEIGHAFNKELQEIQDGYKKLSKYGNVMLVAIPQDSINKLVYPAYPHGLRKNLSIKGVDNTDMDVIMKILAQEPQCLDADNSLEFCLTMTEKDGGMDPYSGIKVFPIISGDKAQLEELQKKENELFARIRFAIEEKIRSSQKVLGVSDSCIQYKAAGIVPYALDESGDVWILAGADSLKNNQLCDFGGLKDSNDGNKSEVTAAREAAEELLFILDKDATFNELLKDKAVNASATQNYLLNCIKSSKDCFKLINENYGYISYYIKVPFNAELTQLFKQRKNAYKDQLPAALNEKEDVRWVNLSEIVKTTEKEISSSAQFYPPFLDSLLKAKAAGFMSRMQLHKPNPDNFYELQPSLAYRTKTLEKDVLENYIKTHNIKTILNLREVNSNSLWYKQEEDLAKKHGIALKTVALNPLTLPTIEQLKQILNAFDKMPRPLLIHCEHGADRTGLVSALWVIEKMNGTLEQALRQLDSFLSSF